MKKALSILLALMLLLSVVPTFVISSFAEENTDLASGDGWRIDSENVLHITGAINNKETADAPWANSGTGLLYGVVAEKGSSIENCSNLFYEQHFLKTADLHNLDTSAVENMEKMFAGCSRLEYLNLKGIDTSNVTSMAGMFQHCWIKELDLTGLNTSKVKNFSKMFYWCQDLEKLNISGWNTSSAENMSFMFCYSDEIEKLDVSSFNTSNVTDMSYMFYCCDKIGNIDCSGFDTRNVTNMEHMFGGCWGWETLNLGSFTLSITENVEGMFSNNIHLKNLDVSGFNQNKFGSFTADDFGYIIRGCEELEKIKATPFFFTHTAEQIFDIFKRWKNVDTGVIYTDASQLRGLSKTTTIIRDYSVASGTGWDLNVLGVLTLTGPVSYSGSAPWASRASEIKVVETKQGASVNNCANMFKNCENLVSLDIGALDTSRVSVVTDMYRGCNNLVEITVNQDTLSKTADQLIALSGKWGNKNSNDVFYTSAAALKKLTGVSELYSCRTSDSWYIDPWGVLHLTGAVKNISDIHMAQIGSLNGVDETPWQPLKDKIVGVVAEKGSSLNCGRYLFRDCDNLRSVDLRNLDTSEVDTFEYMFYKCRNVESINMSGVNTSNVTKMHRMFTDCSSLTFLDISGFDFSHVETAYEMFLNCEKLENLDVSNFDTSSLTNAREMFAKCRSLKKLDVSHFDTSKVTDMASMFGNCSSVTELDVSGFDTSRCTVMHYMFQGCISLKELDVSSFNTSLVTSMTAMFRNCSNLKELDLSNFNTSNVGYFRCMFQGCSSLKELDLSNFDTGRVQSIDGMFAGMVDLYSLDISNFDLTRAGDDGHLLFEEETQTVWYPPAAGSDSDGFITFPYNGPEVYPQKITLGPKALSKVAKTLAWTNFNWYNEDDGTYYFSEPGFLSIDKIVTLKRVSGIGFGWWVDQAFTLHIEGDIINPSVNSDESPWKEYKSQIKKVIVEAPARVNSCAYLFSSCAHLETADLHNLITTNVVSMDRMFSGDLSLKEVNMSGLSLYQVNSMDRMLYACPKLVSLTAPSKVYRGAASDLLDTCPVWFDVCSNKYLSTITEISHVLDNEPITRNENKLRGVSGWHLDTANVLFIYGEVNSITVNGETIAPWNYYKDDIVKVVTLPGASTTVCKQLFKGSTALSSADLSNLDTSAATDMEGMFADCKKLKTLNMSGINTNGVHSFTKMFDGCVSLKSLDLSSFNTPSLLRTDMMFRNCSNLENLDISNVNLAKATNVAQMFNNCSSLAKIKINQSALAKTADQLLTISSKWSNNAAGTLYDSAAGLESINGTVTLEKTHTINEVTLNGTIHSGDTLNDDGPLYITPVEGVDYASFMFNRNGKDLTTGTKATYGNYGCSVMLVANADYKFTENTTLYFNGQAVFPSDIMGDGMYAYYDLPTISVACAHSSDTWLYSTSEHYQICRTCGGKFNTATHSLTSVSDGTNITTTCSICGFSRTGKIPETRTFIRYINLDIGTAFVGERKPTAGAVNYAQDYDMNRIYDVATIKSVTWHTSGTFTAEKAYVTVVLEARNNYYFSNASLAGAGYQYTWESRVASADGNTLTVELSVRPYVVTDVTVTLPSMLTPGKTYADIGKEILFTENGTAVGNYYFFIKKVGESGASGQVIDGVPQESYLYSMTFEPDTEYELTALLYSDYPRSFTVTNPNVTVITDLSYGEGGANVVCYYTSGSGHNYDNGTITKQASCTEDGLIVFSCADCSATKTVNIPKLGHSVKNVYEVSPTCTENGTTTGTVCSRCQTVLSGCDSIPATGHHYTTKVTAPTCTSYGFTTHTCSDCGSSYKDTYKDALGHTDGEWRVTKPATTKEEGVKTLYCLICGEAIRTEKISVIVEEHYLFAKDGTTANVDYDNHIITGLRANLSSLDEYVYLLKDDFVLEYKGKIGTGCKVDVKNNTKILETYTVVIFGDVNGDGWYDGMDAIIVSCFANGMLTESDVSEAEYMAADCNHDGAIDQLDVDILQQAGVLLAQVDQSKSEEELLETSSAYVEYLNLIDQTVDADEDTTDIPIEEPYEPSPMPVYQLNIFEKIIAFFMAIWKYIFSFMPV